MGENFRFPVSATADEHRGISGKGMTSTAQSQISRLFPQGVEVAVADTSGQDPCLIGSEVQAIRRAVASRQREFRRGRGCARRALGRLGLAPTEIPVGRDREPLWPEGYVGSITHCEGFVGAVASPTRVCSALGFDAEPIRPLPPETRNLILTVGEMEQTAASTAFPSLELVFFSAKEAIHKALFPKTRIWMDFLDVELRLDADPSVLLASGVGKVAPGLESLVIRALHFDQLVVTGAFLLAP